MQKGNFMRLHRNVGSTRLLRGGSKSAIGNAMSSYKKLCLPDAPSGALNTVRAAWKRLEPSVGNISNMCDT